MEKGGGSVVELTGSGAFGISIFNFPLTGRGTMNGRFWKSEAPINQEEFALKFTMKVSALPIIFV